MHTPGKPGLIHLQLAIIALGVVLLVIGIQRGELSLILRKAINICFECIGIG